MRVSPPRIDPACGRAPRPAAGAPGADAHRQTGFVLGGQVDLVLAGLALEGQAAEALSGAKFRTQRVASTLAMWSRGWLSRLEALHAMEVGAYIAAMPLVRASADYLAAEVALLGADAAEWQAWIDEPGVALAPNHHALEYRLHPFRSGEALAANPRLGEVYRVTSDFALPHFGTTLTLAGAASDPDRIAVTFGDRDFHVALAELVLGWLATLGSVQLTTVLESAATRPGLVELSSAITDVVDRLAGLGDDKDRCRVEVFESGGVQRYLVHQFRRTPSAAPVRLLL